ncbi:MAG: bile acid:sodium symporter family protein [Verrucomicrobia bacterium]|nr:bile acid:sodium symporter family protein [Verrucomicrobiota bacterium]
MIVKVALPLILAFIMFSLGLGLRKQDFTRVLKYPKAFGTGAFNQLILLPLFAFGLAKAFNFPPEIAVGVMILSFCPGGVTSNVLTRIGKGNTALSISLTAITSLISVVTVPALVALSVHHFMGVDGPEVDITGLGITMCLITAVPVALGMLLTGMAPKMVEKISTSVSRTAIILFVIIIVAALAKNWAVFYDNLPTLGPALVLLNIIMLALGLITSRLVKLDSVDATTISIESGVQNGTLGIAVGTLIALNATETLPPVTVPSAVYSIIMYFISVPFVLWRRRLEK